MPKGGTDLETTPFVPLDYLEEMPTQVDGANIEAPIAERLPAEPNYPEVAMRRIREYLQPSQEFGVPPERNSVEGTLVKRLAVGMGMLEDTPTETVVGSFKPFDTDVLKQVMNDPFARADAMYLAQEMLESQQGPETYTPLGVMATYMCLELFIAQDAADSLKVRQTLFERSKTLGILEQRGASAKEITPVRHAAKMAYDKARFFDAVARKDLLSLTRDYYIVHLGSLGVGKLPDQATEYFEYSRSGDQRRGGSITSLATEYPDAQHPDFEI